MKRLVFLNLFFASFLYANIGVVFLIPQNG